MAEIKKDVAYIKEKLEDFSQTYDNRHTELVDMIKEISSSKAPMIAWDVLKWAGGIIGSTLLVMALYTIFK